MKQEEDKLFQRDERKNIKSPYFQTLCLFLFLAVLSDLNSSMCISIKNSLHFIHNRVMSKALTHKLF